MKRLFCFLMVTLLISFLDSKKTKGTQKTCFPGKKMVCIPVGRLSRKCFCK